MKRAAKIRKTVIRISAGVILTCLVVMTLQINLQGDNSNSLFSISTLTFGFVQPATAQQVAQNFLGGGCSGRYKGYYGFNTTSCFGSFSANFTYGCTTIRTVNNCICGAAIVKSTGGDKGHHSCHYK